MTATFSAFDADTATSDIVAVLKSFGGAIIVLAPPVN